MIKDKNLKKIILSSTNMKSINLPFLIFNFEAFKNDMFSKLSKVYAQLRQYAWHV